MLSSFLGSEAPFTEYVRNVKLDQFLDRFHANHWKTLNDFAHATSFTPGMSDDTRFIQDIVQPIMGDSREHLSPLRRLFFEAFTLVTAEMRRVVERTGDEKPRKLSLPEREARRRAIEPKLGGLDVMGAHGVSHDLVDLCTHIAENKILKYIKWESCTTLEEELNGATSKPEWKADANGVIREQPGSSTATTRAKTDLQLFNLLARRGIASEMGGIMQFETHQKLTQRLLFDMNTEPPPGYERPSYTQIRAADAKAWQLLGQACVDGIRPTGPNRTNVDDAMAEVLADARFTMLWLPQRAPTSSSEGPPAKRHKGKATKGQGRGAWQKAPQQSQTNPKGAKAGKGKSKSKGKGKGKGGKHTPTMPAELIGGVPQTDANEAICFNYNTAAGCTWANPGEFCQKGKHVCCVPGCFQNHTWYEHQ